MSAIGELNVTQTVGVTKGQTRTDVQSKLFVKMLRYKIKSLERSIKRSSTPSRFCMMKYIKKHSKNVVVVEIFIKLFTTISMIERRCR